MFTRQFTLTIPASALNAAENLLDVLHSLNAAGTPYALETTTTPYGAAKYALHTVLSTMVDPDHENGDVAEAFARFVYDAAQANGNGIGVTITDTLGWTLRTVTDPDAPERDADLFVRVPSPTVDLASVPAILGGTA